MPTLILFISFLSLFFLRLNITTPRTEKERLESASENSYIIILIKQSASVKVQPRNGNVGKVLSY